MKRLMLCALLITTVLFSQQRYLVTPTNEAILLRNNESAIEIIQHDFTTETNDLSTCVDKFTFGYQQSLFPVETYFLAKQRQYIGMWFISPASGTIDTLFWQMGSAVNVFDSLIYIRIHRSNVFDGFGPGYDPYPQPCVPWGYYRSFLSNWGEVAAFIENATDTSWISTMQGNIKTFPPAASEMWGLGGFPALLKPKSINRITMLDLGTPLLVLKDQPIFVSMLLPTVHSLPCNSPTPWPTEFAANVSQAPQPSRIWSFHFCENDPDVAGCGGLQSTPKGWYARGGSTGINDAYVLNWWFTMTATTNTPPVFVSIDKPKHTLSTNERVVYADIEYCCPQPSIPKCGIHRVSILYSTDKSTWESISMTNVGGDLFEGFIPSYPGNTSVWYYITAHGTRGDSSLTPSFSYKIVGLSNAYYTLDTSVSYNWVEIESTGTAITNWFGTVKTAGPFDLGGTFRLFGSEVRYAWVGVDGALSLSTTPTDTIRINLCPANYPKDIPSTCLPRNFISPFFNDLTLAYWKNHSASRLGDGAVYYQQVDSKFIVEWNSVRNSDDSTDAVTFQVILDRSDNSIIFQYNDVGISGLDSSALAGLQYEPTEKWFFVNQNGAPPELRPRNEKAIKLKPNFTLQVHGGWNLISNPASVLNERKDILFPNVISSAFTYQNGYIKTDTIKHGRGYWLKFTNAQTLGINGDPRLVDTIEVKQGWNIIGSISVPVPVSPIVQIPAGIIASDFFEYTGSGYAIADTLKPGSGYWVKASADGKLVLSGLSKLKPHKK